MRTKAFVFLGLNTIGYISIYCQGVLCSIRFLKRTGSTLKSNIESTEIKLITLLDQHSLINLVIILTCRCICENCLRTHRTFSQMTNPTCLIVLMC